MLDFATSRIGRSEHFIKISEGFWRSAMSVKMLKWIHGHRGKPMRSHCGSSFALERLCHFLWSWGSPCMMLFALWVSPVPWKIEGEKWKLERYKGEVMKKIRWFGALQGYDLAEINELVNNLAVFIGLRFSSAPSKSIITEDPTWFGHDLDVIDFKVLLSLCIKGAMVWLLFASPDQERLNTEREWR